MINITCCLQGEIGLDGGDGMQGLPVSDIFVISLITQNTLYRKGILVGTYKKFKQAFICT